MAEDTVHKARSALRERVAAMAAPWLGGPRLTPDELAAFEAEWLQQGMNNWGVLLVCVVAASVLWWPTDAFGYGPSPQGVAAFAVARSYTVLSCLVVLTLLSLSDRFRRQALRWMGVMGLSVQFVWANQMARIGPPHEAWFSGLCISVFIPVAVALPLRTRIGISVGFALATIAGYFGQHPQYWTNYLTPSLISYLFFLTTMSILSGIYADRLRQESFSFRQKLARQAVELQLFNEQLDQRVREATAELRSLATHLESVRESERAHISRELHDELGQQLTALSLTASVARARYEQNPQGIGALLTQVESLISRTRTTTRNLVSNLRPQILDDLGFAPGLDWLVRQMEARTGASATLQLPNAEWAPPRELSLPLFRIVQESLTNISRHAQARRVAIEITEEGTTIRLRIVDDGVGFQLDEKRSGKMGIVGMRERARAVEGDLEVLSVTSGGTTVQAWFPKAAPSEKAAA